MYKKAILQAWGRFLCGGGLVLVSQLVHADISGKAFRDFNANGAFDSSAAFHEVGVAGITVKAFDTAGAQAATAISAAEGSYTLVGLDSGADYRLEFSWPENWLKESAAGGTSVQFVQDGATDVNFGVNEPADYSQSNPPIIVAGQLGGLPTGDASTDTSIYSIPYDTTGFNREYHADSGVQGLAPVPSRDAAVGNTGAIWGVAWQADKRRVFATAMIKRHSGLLGGEGDVYVVDYQHYSYADNHAGAPGSYAGKFSLQGVKPSNSNVLLDFGSVCRSSACGLAADYELNASKGAPTWDLDGFRQVGRMAIGDADMQPGTNTLWLVNLYQKGLVAVDVSGDSASLPGEVRQYLIESLPNAPVCNGGGLRPWALAFRNGKGYLGAVCDAALSGDDADLQAFVLSFDPAHVEAGFTVEVSTELNYAHEHLKFMPWLDAYTAPPVAEPGTWNTFAPQPVLSDLEFDESGNLYLNFMDRFGHQTGNENYPAESGRNQIRAYNSEGDILKACKTAVGFAIEGSPDCNTGKAMGEFFDDIAGDGSKEGPTGAFLQRKGSQQLVTSLMDPHPAGEIVDCELYPDKLCWWNTQGIQTFNLQSGQIDNWYTIRNSKGTGDAGKGSGLGDMELMSDPAPVEIGNRVWLDSDGDGIQDAGEAGIPNVEVKLLAADGSTVLATATTAADGTYYFSSAAGTSTASTLYGVSALQPGTAYTLKFPTTVTVSGAAYKPTTVTVGGNREIDSNASSVGLAPITTLDIPVAGANNHSFDVGYAEVKVDVALTKTVEPAAAKRGETVVYTLTVTNTGEGVATGVKVVDKLPAGLTFVSHDGATPAVYDAVTGEWDVGTVGVGAANAVSLGITATVQ